MFCQHLFINQHHSLCDNFYIRLYLEMLTYHVFWKVSFDSKLNPAQRASKLSLALIVSSLLVVLQCRPVTEDGRTERTCDDLSCMRRSDVSVQACATREFRIAFVTLEIFLTRVSLHVSGQSFSVLESSPALITRKCFVRICVQIFVDGQVIFSWEGFVAKVARVPEVWMSLVSSLVSFQAVAPLEGLAAVGAHVVTVWVVGVHVWRQVFLEPEK